VERPFSDRATVSDIYAFLRREASVLCDGIRLDYDDTAHLAEIPDLDDGIFGLSGPEIEINWSLRSLNVQTVSFPSFCQVIDLKQEIAGNSSADIHSFELTQGGIKLDDATSLSCLCVFGTLSGFAVPGRSRPHRFHFETANDSPGC
jgi:hypothetical protein